MRSGDLRHRLTLLKRSDGRNAMGEAVASWGAVSSMWGSFQPLLGKDFMAAQQFQSPVTAKVRIRYNEDVTDIDRIQFDGTDYDIVGLQNVDGRNVELVLYVSEAPG